MLLFGCGGGDEGTDSEQQADEDPLTGDPMPVTPSYGPNAFAYEGTGIATLTDRGLSGLGVDVCIVDTGLAASHPAFDHLFARNAVTWMDFTDENAPNPIDTNGHGTHVAGIVAMNDELTGGAPHTDLLVARVFKAEGGADSATLARAVDWCRENAADVISMSLGGLTLPAIEELLQSDASESEAAVQRALDAGIYVVAAAGNTEPARDVATPAGVSGVIAVGALEQDLETKASFSQSGINDGGPIIDPRSDPDKKPEISAPGVDITSGIAAESTLAEDTEGCANTEYCPLSGTSQATPFVTAALALVLEARPELQHENQDGDPSEAIRSMKNALAASAATLPDQDEPHDDGVGYGLIRADQLLEAF
jgi:subtilisin family serine protease